MDKNLLQKAKAPMIALIHQKNIVKTRTKRAFALLLLLALIAPMAARAQDFGNPSRAIDECRKPTQLTVSQITANSAQLSWTENGEATAWYIMLNEDYDHLVYADTNPFTLTELTPETRYIVKVRPYCENEKWSNEIAFTTLESCPAPTRLQVTNLTTTTATLGWTANGEATVWQICLNGDENNLIDATTNPYTLENLTPETVYTAKVRSNCGDGVSRWSDALNFVPNARLYIGSGNETCEFLPTYNYFEYSLTEQIYTVEELGDAGLIEIIDFFNVNYNGCDRDLDIYLVSTDKSSFEYSFDRIAYTEADLCFSGNVNFANNDWTSIVLDEPFFYDGLQNVAIVVYDHTGSWSYDYMSFLSFTTSTYQAIYQYADGKKSGSGITNSKNQIRVLKDEIGDCMRPTNFTASVVGPDFANLSWVEHGTSTAWVIDYNGTTVTTTENPYTLSGLGNETEYTVKVRPACDENLWSIAITFTTLEACPAPTSLQATNAVGRNATLSWTGFSQGYEVQYRASVYKGGRGATVGGEWQTLFATEPTITLTNLTPETTYEAKVQGDCGNDVYSEWSEIITFTTGLFDGNGTEDDPYIIATTDDMDELASQVNSGNNYSGTFFLMTADLDYSGKDYSPIGNNNCGFKGTFNGNGHTISHVIIQSTRNFIGLFGWLESGGCINGLTLGEGSSIHGFNRVGGIVGQCGGAINGCNIVEGITISADKTFVGGIVGDCVGGNVSNCQNRAAVSSNTIACGGIVGIVSSGGEVLQCSNYGSVQASENCGGIVGRLVDCSMVTECINEGSISGDEKVGGIVGFIDNQNGNCFCSVSNCLNLGGVSASNSNYLGSISGSGSMGANFNNNYYASECTVGGINGNDVAGEAMRGYTIEAYAPLSISLDGSIGLLYEGKVYAGNGQSVVVGLNTPLTPQCYILSGGALSDNGDDTFTITMPAENITISGNIVEQDGLYYAIPCEGGNTAMLIHDDSYATLHSVMIDENITFNETDYLVTAIADGAFDGCDSIQYVDCHAQLTAIGDYAFRNCTSLEYIGLYNGHTPPTVGTGCFDGLGLDTLWLMVPFCSQYDYAIHGVWGQFGTLFPDGNCEYNFIGSGGDRLWSNPDNWYDGEMPGAGAQVGIMSDCEMDTDVTIGSITIGNYYDEYYGLYERLTVKSGNTLTASNFIYTTGDERNFVIEDGAQVYHPNAGAKATVEKNITAFTVQQTQGNAMTDGWHLIGSPATESFAPSEGNGFLANEYDLYYYHEPTHYWRNHKTGTNNADPGFDILPQRGYLYANSVNVTLGLTGTLNAGNATVSLPLSYTASAGSVKGFNLVPNPFAHNVTAYTGSNVATEVYRMNGDKTDLMVSEVSATVPLLPGEGFFVKATGNNANITFNSSAKGENVKYDHIALEISENGLVVDRFIVKNEGEPLEKFTLNENSTKIFATREGQDWAVVTMEGNEQAVHFKAAKNGTYTLTFDIENVDFNYLHLIDNLTGADVDLLQTREYTFAAKTTDYASRFRLVFDCGDTDGDNVDAPFAFINNGQIVITAEVDDATLQVVDMMGHVIYQGDAKHCVSTNGMATGVYVLRLIDGDKKRTQKIVLR